MGKLDLKKELKNLYNPAGSEIALVEVPPLNFIMADGEGDPNTSERFQQATEALYGASYTLKFALKKKGIGPEYSVMPLEGLWWMDDMTQFSAENKDLWKWTIMIAQPPFVTKDMAQNAITELRSKKPWTAMQALRFEELQEGLSVQTLYIGPYSEEAPTIAKMHEFAKEQGCELAGKHHEIYLSDPRRTPPEKWKTVLRQPVRKI